MIKAGNQFGLKDVSSYPTIINKMESFKQDLTGELAAGNKPNIEAKLSVREEIALRDATDDFRLDLTHSAVKAAIK